jgi:hypothetical protein
MRSFILPLFLVVMAPSAVSAQQTLPQQNVEDQARTAGIFEEVVVADYPSLPLRELTSTAGTVVHVVIRRGNTFRTGDRASIQTDYKAAVVDVVKAPSASRLNAGDEITIRRLGGVINIEGHTVYSNEGGFPQFAAGSEYVLFLRTQPGQPFELVTGPLSAFRVQEGAIVFGDQDPQAVAIPMPLFVREVKELSQVTTPSR